MNANERVATAKAIVDLMPDDPDGEDIARAEEAIVKALRAAETEALERAAKLVERWHITKGGYTEMAHQLRSLKEPTPGT